MTSIDMAGASLTLLKLDDETKAGLDAPSAAVGFRV
jgi:dihydroxyacetone kinase